MKNTLLLISLLLCPLITSGCSLTNASVVQHPNSSKVTSDYSAKTYREQIGLGKVRYLDGGTSNYRDARRADAFKKMNSSCGSPYTIIDEYRLNSFFGYKTDAAPDGQMGLLEFWSNQYIYIEFECQKS